MINWLRTKTKFSFHLQHINRPILHHHNQEDMMPENNITNKQEDDLSTETLKICIQNENGEKYLVSVRSEMTINNIIMMSIGHFFHPFETAGLSENSDFSKVKVNCSPSKDCYRLVQVRNLQTLANESTVRLEGLLNFDKLLLVKNRKSTQNYIKSSNLNKNALAEGKQVTKGQIIAKSTELGIQSKNQDRDANPMKTDLDFKITFRQIVMTMIEASIHLISSEDDAADLFVIVFEHLVKRNKPRVDKNSLKEIVVMGFSEARAIKALRYKKSFQAAIDWLLEETNKCDSETGEQTDIFQFSTFEEKRQYFLSGSDPTAKVMEEFNKYVDMWFTPDIKAMQNLISLDYKEDEVKKALKDSCNIENIAKEILKGNISAKDVICKGFDRDSPIMSAILDSPIVQAALTKAKTLFALMVLCETPNNVNVWLSDPETHPVVSQILRIYHAEKYRIGSDMSDVTYSQSNLQDQNTMHGASKKRLPLPYVPYNYIASMPELNELSDPLLISDKFTDIYVNSRE